MEGEAGIVPAQMLLVRWDSYALYSDLSHMVHGSWVPRALMPDCLDVTIPPKGGRVSFQRVCVYCNLIDSFHLFSNDDFLRTMG